MEQNSTVVIGAGPYRLSVASHLKAQGIPPQVFGKPMGFWKEIPEGMYLKSVVFGDISITPVSIGRASTGKLPGIKSPFMGVPTQKLSRMQNPAFWNVPTMQVPRMQQTSEKMPAQEPETGDVPTVRLPRSKRKQLKSEVSSR